MLHEITYNVLSIAMWLHGKFGGKSVTGLSKRSDAQLEVHVLSYWPFIWLLLERTLCRTELGA